MVWKSSTLWLRPTICVILLELCSMSTHANRMEKPKHGVRYTVISNSVVSNKDWDDEKRRISILMDSADFTEPKLRRLMTYFFKKYPRPDSMSVDLYSHSDQSDFLNRRLPHMKDPKRDEAFRKYPFGGFSRINGNEVIRYATPPTFQWKTIVVKGKD